MCLLPLDAAFTDIAGSGTLHSSSVEYLRQEWEQEGAEWKGEYHESREIVREVDQMHLDKPSLFPGPLIVGIPVLHEKPHKTVDLVGFMKQQCSILRYHSGKKIFN